MNLVRSIIDTQLISVKKLSVHPQKFTIDGVIEEINKIFEFTLAGRKLFFHIKNNLPKNTEIVNDKNIVR